MLNFEVYLAFFLHKVIHVICHFYCKVFNLKLVNFELFYIPSVMPAPGLPFSNTFTKLNHTKIIYRNYQVFEY